MIKEKNPPTLLTSPRNIKAVKYTLHKPRDTAAFHLTPSHPGKEFSFFLF